MSQTMASIAISSCVFGILFVLIGFILSRIGSRKKQGETFVVCGLVFIVVSGLIIVMFGGLTDLPSLPLHFVSADTSGGGHNALVNKTESITLDDIEIVIKFLIALLFTILAGWVQISDLPWKNFKRTVIFLFLTASLGSLIWILFPAP